MKSFIKISMLLWTSLLMAGSANARGMAVNDEYLNLSQEEPEQSVVASDSVQQVNSSEVLADEVATNEISVEASSTHDEVAVNEVTVSETAVSSEVVANEVFVSEMAVSEEVVRDEVATSETVVSSEVAVNEISAEDKKSDESVQVVVSEAKPEDDSDTFETASSISSEDLEDNRGAYSPSSTGYLLGNSSNNSVNNSVTGGNVISEGAFNSSTGLVSVIQNSGNNVLIQSSTIVNVEMNN